MKVSCWNLPTATGSISDQLLNVCQPLSNSSGWRNATAGNNSEKVPHLIAPEKSILNLKQNVVNIRFGDLENLLSHPRWDLGFTYSSQHGESEGQAESQ